MRRDLDLTARYVGFPPSLCFTLDDETLQLGGPDAEAVAGLLRAAQAAGFVTIDPYPTSVEIVDPFNDRSQLAAVLSEGYRLPDWLQAWALEGVDLDDSEDGMPSVTY